MESPGARIVVLGGPSIDCDDGTAKPATLPGGRAELVFAYLAVEHRRAVGRDELADALWPELLPDSWAASLRGVVTEVRRFLDDAGLSGSALLSGARGAYQLRLPPTVTVDVDEARAGLAQARAGLEQGDPARAAACAARVATIAALPFLPRHDGGWVQTIRAELETIQVAALELAARAHARTGDVRAASAAAERLVRVEPYSEAAYRLLIDALGRAGDRAGALRAYERCRGVLRSELGLEPSRETEAVLTRALGASTGGAPMPADPAPAEPVESAASNARSAPPRQEPAFASYAVLVVEDHDFQRRTALTLLRRLGVGRVLEAADGSAALELLAGISPPDVILCDIDMPGMDGVEFIRHVARLGLASAVAIASGLDRRLLETVRAVGEGYGLQVLGAVEKPLTARKISELLAAFRRSPPLPQSPGALRLSATQIAAGLSDGRVVAQLEPIADLSTGRIAAAEIVPCWRDHASALVEPASLTAALEVPATIERLSDRLVALAGAAARELAEAGLALEIATRLPQVRLADAALADRLAGVAQASGAGPGRIVLGVGAAALAGGAAVALDVLARARLKGFGLWLDDVGTETRLDRVPLTGARLAAALVAAAATDSRSATALHDVVDRARALGLVVIGPGCTGAAEFGLLLDVGASRAQGAVVGGPMSVPELVAWAGAWTPPAPIPDEAR